MRLKNILSALLATALCAGAAVFSGGAAGDAALVGDSKLRIEDSHLTRVRLGTTVSALAEEFTSDITVKNGDTALDGDETVKSGYTLTAGETVLTLAVTGDVNGDGRINLADVSSIMRYVAKWNPSITVPAIDANLDGKFNLSDASLLMQSVAGWDVYVGTFDVVYSEDRITAPSEDSTLRASVLDNMQKIDRRDAAIGDSATLMLKMARNELESCLIYLASENGHKDLSVTFTPFGNGEGAVVETEMFLSHYVSSEAYDDPTAKVYYPDAMLPLAAFDVPAGESRSLLLKIKPTEDTEPGLYESRITVRDGSGRALKVLKVWATVWDMALPEDTSCATAFGLNWYSIYTTHQMYDGDDSVLYCNYYDYLLENRISAYHLPYKFSDPRFEEYMNDPRVTSFCVDGCQANFELLTDEELSALYEKYGDNENWKEKAYFYMVDEPSRMEQCQAIVDAAARLNELFPGFRQVVPCYTNGWYGDMDQTEFLEQAVNLWCPLTSFFAEGMAYNDKSVEKYGTAEERFNGYVESRGDDFWWYVCVSPRHPFANFFTNYQGEWSRALFWQQYDYGATGCLYWSVNYWVGNFWRSADNDFYSGDGLLLYPGNKYDIYGPIGSLRIEYIRDGIEDYEYLVMAEELCGAEAVEQVLRTVTTDITHYTEDSAVIEAAKETLAMMIMENMD